MANETVANQTSVALENGRWVYRRGYINGCKGSTTSAFDRLHIVVPQLAALQHVVADEEFPWNDTMRQHLMYLAMNLADEVNELIEEDFANRENRKLDRQTPDQTCRDVFDSIAIHGHEAGVEKFKAQHPA